MVNDPISNFLIKLKNAARANSGVVSVPHSALIESIANILEKEGYLKSVTKRRKKNQKFIDVELASVSDRQSKVIDIERVSKSSKRVYAGFRDIRPYKNGFGRSVLSTSKGLMTDLEARKARLGGEVLFKIW